MATATVKKPRPKHKPLTPREKRLLLLLPECKTYEQALLDAGYAPSTARKFQKPIIDNVIVKSRQEGMIDEFEKAGITPEKIAEKHLEGLEAYRVISANVIHKSGKGKEADSQTNDFIEVPDFPARHKHLDTIHKIRGDFAKEKVEHSGNVAHTIEVMDYGSKD
jgi:hypothetical protein